MIRNKEEEDGRGNSPGFDNMKIHEKESEEGWVVVEYEWTISRQYLSWSDQGGHQSIN